MAACAVFIIDPKTIWYALGAVMLLNVLGLVFYLRK